MLGRHVVRQAGAWGVPCAPPASKGKIEKKRIQPPILIYRDSIQPRKVSADYYPLSGYSLIVLVEPP